MVMATNQIVTESPQGGNEQAIDRLNDRWMCSITLPIRTHADSRALEAFLASFRGQVNWINLWHLAQPAPLGTMRGAPTLAEAAAQGASSLTIMSTVGATLKAGDMIGVGGLLLMVAEDCAAVAVGVDPNITYQITAPLVNRIRTAQALGAAVTWDKPTAQFRQVAHSGVNYVAGVSDEVTLELRERIAA